MSMMNSVFSAVGAASVFTSTLFWDRSNLSAFRLYCIGLSIVAAVGFEMCARNLKGYYVASSKSDVIFMEPDTQATAPAAPGQKSSWWTFLGQISRNPNFVLFSILHLVQVFHCHFNSNFFPFFLEVFLSSYLTPSTQGLLLAFSFIMPHVNNIFFTRLVQRRGSYDVIFILILVKFAMALMMLLIGPSSTIMLIVFIASNRIFTEVTGTC